MPLAVDENWSIKLTSPSRAAGAIVREEQADIITILFTIDQSFRCSTSIIMKAAVLDENSDKRRYADSSSVATSRSLPRVPGNVCCSFREADVRLIRNKQISGRT